MDQVDIDLLQEYQNVSKQVYEIDLLIRHNLYLLQLEVPELWLEYSRLKSKISPPDEPEFINPIIKSDKDKAKKNKDKKPPELKKLYRFISQITHPDKTDDQNLQYLFQLAKTYYDCNNLTEMKILYEIVKLNSFVNIVDLLNAQRRKLFEQIHSVEFQICQMFENPLTVKQAIQSFRSLLLNEIANLNSQGIL